MDNLRSDYSNSGSDDAKKLLEVREENNKLKEKHKRLVTEVSLVLVPLSFLS